MSRTLAIFIGAALLALTTLAASGDEFRDRIVVVDRSNSMWARLDDGEARYQVADRLAESLARSMAAAQPDVTFGLVALGNRFRRAAHRCDDVETVIRPTPLSNPATVDTVARTAGSLSTPKGMTPLTEAIQEAARNLPEGGSIIVISDFNQTCDGDAEKSCDAIAALKARGALIGISIRYIVALADLDTALPGMARYADCTGAKLLRVYSSDSAKRMASAIAADLAAQSQALRLTVRFSLNKPTDIAPAWGAPPLDGNVAYSGAPGRGRAAVDGPNVAFRVRAGVYKVVVNIAGLSRSADIRVGRGRDNQVFMSIHAAHLSLKAVGPEGERIAAGDVVWTLRAQSGAQVARQGDTAEFDLPPGRYQVDIRSSAGGAHLELDLGPGQTLERSVRLDAALAATSEGRVTFDPKVVDPSLFADHARRRPELVLRPAGGNPVRIAPQPVGIPMKPGHYDATIEWYGHPWTIAPIEIAGDRSSNISARIVPTTLTATLSGKADADTVWRIRREDDGSEAALRGARLEQSLPPGDYRISAEAHGQSWQGRVRIDFGKAADIILDEN